ncbi:MAG TPA: DUF3179 domain-containing (seleno)protein [Humisphaera sp.]|nr:DUF3179 domain-containing (seleno)protein [Humisphaera sp.]
MLVPLGLIMVAVSCGFAVAYGTDTRWMQFSHGLQIIVDSRKFQWPLVVLSLAASIGLLGLSVSGRKRVWWLLGLAPVLALFAHRFALGPAAGEMSVADNPPFIAAADARSLRDDDYVVGLTFDDASFAYPYSILFYDPVVITADHQKRIILLWSAYANRATAFTVRHDLRAHDLEIVGTPGNALLVYDGRLGQFINGLRGQTITNQKPATFALAVATQTMPWGQWRGLHPDTKVMQLPPNGKSSEAAATPLTPTCVLPPMKLDHPASMRIAMVGTTQPSAIESDHVGSRPINLRADNQPIFIYREVPGQPIRGFARRITAELLPRFVSNTNPQRHPTARFVDVDTNSGWDAAGRWVDGLKDLKGKKLDPVAVDDNLYWGVMKFWYPDLQLETPPATLPSESIDEENPRDPPTRGRSRSRRGTTTPPTRGTPRGRG